MLHFSLKRIKFTASFQDKYYFDDHIQNIEASSQTDEIEKTPT